MDSRKIAAVGLCLLISVSSGHTQAVQYCKDSASAVLPSGEPGGTDADAELASDNPDEYAWQLFFFVSRQAEVGAPGVPDPAVAPFKNHSDTPAVWESWALSSGPGKYNEVFSCPAKQPDDWDQLPRSAKGPGLKPALGRNLTATESRGLERFDNSPGDDRDLEVRINKATYDTVREGLWSGDGVLLKAENAEQAKQDFFVCFPPGSKATKAVWVELCDDADKCPKKQNLEAHYHWRSIPYNRKTSIWGLAALHIVAREKNMPKWFWADFINRDCLSNETGKCSPSSLKEGTYQGQRPVDSTTGLDGVRQDIPKGSEWANYRLMGTETEFMQKNNAALPQLLSDPRIEDGLKKETSCISCHFYASTEIKSISPRQLLPEFVTKEGQEDLPLIGVPNANALLKSPLKPERQFFQSDFSWFLVDRPRSESPNCDKP